LGTKSGLVDTIKKIGSNFVKAFQNLSPMKKLENSIKDVDPIDPIAMQTEIDTYKKVEDSKIIRKAKHKEKLKKCQTVRSVGETYLSANLCGVDNGNSKVNLFPSKADKADVPPDSPKLSYWSKFKRWFKNVGTRFSMEFNKDMLSVPHQFVKWQDGDAKTDLIQGEFSGNDGMVAWHDCSVRVTNVFMEDYYNDVTKPFCALPVSHMGGLCPTGKKDDIACLWWKARLEWLVANVNPDPQLITNTFYPTNLAEIVWPSTLKPPNFPLAHDETKPVAVPVKFDQRQPI